MKSVREWMAERGMMREDFDKTAMARYFGSTNVEVDPGLKRELRPKIERIIDMDEYRSIPREEVLEKIKVVMSQIVAEMGGSTVSSRSMADRMGDEGSSVDKNKFARMMGGERMDVDQKIKSELKPKIERIMDMEEYESIPKEDLEKKLIAVATQIVSEMSGSTMSLSGAERKLNNFEDDPVAQESAKLPSFLHWIENNENQVGSVSEPQHKQGEENMDLKSVVEKKMMQIAMELESDGKGTRQEVLKAMKAVVDSANEGESEAQPNAQADANASSQPSDQDSSIGLGNQAGNALPQTNQAS